MRQKELIRVMDTKEILQEMAWDMLQDNKYRERIEKEVSYAEQENQTAEEEMAKFDQLFKSIGNVIEG